MTPKKGTLAATLRVIAGNFGGTSGSVTRLADPTSPAGEVGALARRLVILATEMTSVAKS